MPPASCLCSTSSRYGPTEGHEKSFHGFVASIQTPVLVPRPAMSPSHSPSARPDGSAASLATRGRVKREPADDDETAVPADAWEAHRPLITTLYRDQNKRLKDVMFILEESHGFTAT